MYDGGRRPQEVGEIADSLVSFWGTSQKVNKNKACLAFSNTMASRIPKKQKPVAV